MEIIDILGKDGLFDQNLKTYEIRQEQIDLSNQISKCLNNDLNLIAEAPTGTGKSYAYLIPSILKAKSTNSKVVIATSNIALQEQLITKDLPFIQNMLGKECEFTFALAKGRSNFVCLDAVEEVKRISLWNKVSASESKNVKKLIEWSSNTSSGDKSDLDFEPHPLIWDKFSVGNEDCRKGLCSFKDVCFANKAKANFMEADIIVCNYHLLLIDMHLKHISDGFAAILPPFDYLICDEAHNLELVARETFSSEVKPRAISRITATLEKVEKQNKNPYKDKNKELLSVTLKQESEIFFNNVIEYYKNQKNYIRSQEKDFVSYKEICLALFKAAKFLEDYGDELCEKGHEDGELLKSRASEAMKLKNAIEMNIGQPDENYAYWIQYSEHPKGFNVSLNNKPIYVRDYLKTECWHSLKSVILLSATMTISQENNHTSYEEYLNDSFKFMINTLGLNEDIEKFICTSPFNFNEQCGLIVPDNIPIPLYDKESQYKEEFLKSSKEAIKITNGKAMILFTSYNHLNYFYENIKDLRKKYKVLAQGIGEINRTQMIKEFKEDKNSILLGTSSFWEGIDVPGEALSLLIIDKIPFPNIKQDPVLDAMQEKNSDTFFNEEYLPRAILTLKQGIGRLIRTKTDKGCIIIGDKRIIPGCKNYSYKFLNTLPQMPFSNNIESLKYFFKEA